jgi:hypothetical protein
MGAGPIQCPYCGSYASEQLSGPWDWVWIVAAATSFFTRMFVSGLFLVDLN